MVSKAFFERQTGSLLRSPTISLHFFSFMFNVNTKVKQSSDFDTSI